MTPKANRTTPSFPQFIHCSSVISWGTRIRLPPTDASGENPSVKTNHQPTGADVDGVTSCLRSAAKIPNWRTVESGLNLRLVGKLDPERFMALAETFFELGGQHLGVSLTDRDTLLAAVENPEEHLDLEVRVTGYSAFFTGLGEKTQQDIIDRTDH